MGSGGNLLLPDQPGPNPHLVIGVGKLGTIYLVNRDSMGGFNASMDQMVQELSGVLGGMFSTPAYWQGKLAKGVVRNMFYTVAANDEPKSFVIANGMIESTPESIARNFKFGFPGASPVISANNTTGGIMWAINTSNFSTAGTAILYAFDAIDLDHELYDSNQNSGDHPGPAVKFTVPTVANGSVYMGTQTQLAVFGMFPSKLTINPASLVFGEVSVGTTSKPRTVTITDSGRKRSMPLSIAMESTSAPFAIKSQCEKTLKPHKSCKVSVTFAPTNTTARQGTLTIVDDEPNSPQTVSLSGTGKAGSK
jgi:Abnormal spindle-like microcephaly-assoc'd, ASPM-SPD-2-Hydin